MRWSPGKNRRRRPGGNRSGGTGRARKAFRPVLETLELRLAPSADVLTFHNDNARTGANLDETVLTPANVNATNFGKLFSYPVDGYVYAQSLYKSQVSIAGQGTHNVVFAATEHDTVYAFDGDNNQGANANPLWQHSFIDPANGITSVPQPDVISTDIVPEVGITGTPVIDGATNLLYVVAKTKEVRADGSHYVQRLHALDITSGAEVASAVIGDTTFINGVYTNNTTVVAPGTGDGSSGGLVPFNALREHQRPGLVLSGGVVYVAFASHGDNGPYHGWVVGYDAQTLQQVSVWLSTPTGGLGGIWQSGGAPAVDTQGNLVLSTGNGSFGAGLVGPQALGPTGSGLGYGGGFSSYNGIPPIGQSVAVTFRSYDHSATGLGLNGQFQPEHNLTGTGIDFNAGGLSNPPHTFRGSLSYDGAVLTETITDLTTLATYSTAYAVDIPSYVGGDVAYVGFTGGSGAHNAVQEIQTWTYSDGSFIDHSGGFADHSDLKSNGDANFPGTVARLTNGTTGTGGQGESGSVFTTAQVNVRHFNTTFTFQMRPGTLSPLADGITFTIQNSPGVPDYGESVVKLGPTPGGTYNQLPVLDYFTPFEWRSLNIFDTDLGSGAAVVLPTQPGNYPHLAVETGKSGKIYLINLDDMGQYTSQGPDQNLFTVNTGNPRVWASPAFWNNILYYHGSADVTRAFQLGIGSNGKPMLTPVSQSTTSFGFPGAQPSISANGQFDGIDWELQSDAYGTSGPEILHAYDALNLSHELYNSNQTGARDRLSGAVKFVTPTIADGHVYVGAQYSLSVFGLFPDNGQPPDAAPSDLSAMALSPTQIQLSWANNATNATGVQIYRSTDGQNFTLVTTVPRDQTMYTDTGLMPSTTYYYEVVAVNQHGSSAPSNVAVGRTQVAPPIVTIQDVCPSAIVLSWTRTASDHYDIERSTDGTNFTLIASVPATQSSYTDEGLDFGTYYYRVRAYDVDGQSALSAVAQATIGPVSVDHSAGFTDHNDLHANGSAQFAEGVGRLTDGGFNEAGTFFTTQQIGIRAFTTTFDIRVHEGTSPRADGLTFIIQSNGVTALGPGGGGLAYGPDQPDPNHINRGIRNSIAVKFDFFNNAGEGNNSTGLFTDGRSPTVREPGLPPEIPDISIDLNPSGVNLNSQSTKHVVITYDGTNLTEDITDLETMGHFTYTYQVNIPSWVGGDTAYVGFGGGTGGLSAVQDILTWTFDPQEENLPPRAPSNLRVTDASASSATISWRCNNAYTAEGYSVERSSDGTNFTEIAQVGPNTNSYMDQGLAPGTYYYRARSFNANGFSSYSNVDHITIPVTLVVDHSGGFASHGDLTSAGSTVFTGTVAQLTAAVNSQAGSFFYTNQVFVTHFTNTFTFQMRAGSNPIADGITFTIQGVGPTALGANGGGLGYQGIGNSVAVKFDAYKPSGNHSSTGLYVNGHAPGVDNLQPGDVYVDLAGTGIDFNAAAQASPPHVFQVDMTYDGTTLDVTITDLTTGAFASQVYTVDIPSYVGGDLAYVGFTGGTGGLNSFQEIQTWRYDSTGGGPAGASGLTALATAPLGGSGGGLNGVPAAVTSGSGGAPNLSDRRGSADGNLVGANPPNGNGQADGGGGSSVVAAPQGSTAEALDQVFSSTDPLGSVF